MKMMEAAFNQDYVGQAPLIVAVCTTNIDYRMPNGQPSYPVDLSFAASHIVLQAVHEGLGTCWVGWFEREPVKRILGVPDSKEVPILVTIGHPAEKPAPRARKSLDELIMQDAYQGAGRKGRKG